MALSKRVALGNGVTVNYHRVVGFNVTTNVQNTIEVASYTSRAKRAEEEAAVAASEPMNVYIETVYHSVPYDPTMTVAGAYEYLKTLPEFEGAVDVLDDEGGDA